MWVLEKSMPGDCRTLGERHCANVVGVFYRFQGWNQVLREETGVTLYLNTEEVDHRRKTRMRVRLMPDRDRRVPLGSRRSTQSCQQKTCSLKACDLSVRPITVYIEISL